MTNLSLVEALQVQERSWNARPLVRALYIGLVPAGL